MELIIKPQKRLRLDWKEIWSFHELFYFLAWRDIKSRYKQTVIGIAWAVFQPLVMMVIFTILINKVAGIKTPIPYAIFAYSGLLFWNYFAQALNRASDSLVSNQGIITKVYFPRLIVPVSATIVAMIDFFFALLIFVGLMLYFQIIPSLPGILLFIPALLIATLTAAGAGLFFSALNVKYRDVRQALPFLIQVLFFLTPVIYPVTLIPERFHWLLYLNPMTGVITVMRSTLLGEGDIPWPLVGLSVVVSLLVCILGLIYFQRREREFADII
jgi:lipopolysaccharide transport system permease protein